MSGYNWYDYGKVGVRHLRVLYNHVDELTVENLNNYNGPLALNAAQRLSLETTGGVTLQGAQINLMGDVRFYQPIHMSGVRSRTITTNYSAESTDASAESSGLLVQRGSAGDASLLFREGGWRFSGGDLVFGRLGSGGVAGGRFTIDNAANLLLKEEAGSVAGGPLAYFYIDRLSPITTLASQPESFGALSQAPQVTTYVTASMVPWVVSFDYEIANFSTDLLEGVNVASYGPVHSVEDLKFYFDVYPASQGPFTVSVPPGSFVDASNNSAPYKLGYVVTLDSVPPTVLHNGPTTVQEYYESETIEWTLSFDKRIPNFNINLLSKQYNVSQYGTPSTTDQKTFVFDVTAKAEGPVKVSFANGVLFDAAGNFVHANTSPPAVVLQNPPITLTSIYDTSLYPLGYTNSGLIKWTLSFSDYIANLNNTTVQNLVMTSNVSFVALASRSLDSKRFTLSLRATPGTVNVSVPEGLFVSLANHGCTGLTGTALHFDDSPLTAVSYQSSNLTQTRQSPVSWTVSFSKPVTGFGGSVLALTNCALGAVSTSDSQTFMLSLVPDKPKTTISCDVRAAYVRDAFGNPNAFAASPEVLYDSVPPNVVFLRPDLGSSLYTNATPIPWTLRFDKEVDPAGLLGLLKTKNVSSLQNLASSDSKTFTFDVVPDATNIPLTGRIINVSIEAGKIADALGNFVQATAGNTITYDPTPPTATVAYSRVYSSSPTQTYTVTFDKPVSGFDLRALSLSHNVSMYSQITQTQNTYSFDATATSTGSVQVELLGSRVYDRALNYAAGAISPAAYHVVPVPHPIGCSYDPALYPTGYTNSGSPLRWIVKFNEAVANMASAVPNFSKSAGIASLSLFSSSSDATSFVVFAHLSRAFPAGPLQVSIPPNTVATPSGAWNEHGQTGNVLMYSNVAVTATSAPISTVPSNLNSKPIPWVVTFSQPIANFASGVASGLVLTGCSMLSYVQSGDRKTYVLSLDPVVTTPPDVIVGAAVYAGVFQDEYGNASGAAAASRTVRYYGVTPTCLALRPVTNAASTNVTPIPWKAVFDYPVLTSNFANAVWLTGVSYVDNVTVSSSTVFFDVYPNSAGMPSSGVTVSVTLKENALFDAGSNAVAGRTGTSIVYDNVPPTASFSLLSGILSPTALRSLEWLLTFDEPVASFSLGHLSGTNVSYSGLVFYNMSKYKFTSTAVEAGPTTVRIPALSVRDSSHNYVIETTAPTIVYDPVKPEILSLGPQVSGPTNVSPIPYAVTFSKAIANFSIDSLTGSNVNYLLNPSTTSGTTYTFGAVPSGQGSVTVSVSSGVFADLSGNLADGFSSSPIVFDSVKPVASIELATDALSNNPVAHWALTSSKSLSNFTLAALAVANGALTSLSANASHNRFTFYSTALRPGSVSVSLLSSGARDAAGNYADPVTSTMTYDTTPPTVLGSGLASGSTTTMVASNQWTLQFSKPLSNFSLAGVSGANASLGSTFLATNNNATFSFNVAPLSYGMFGVDLVPGVLTDLASNYADVAPLPRASYVNPSFSVAFALLSGESGVTNHTSTHWSLSFGAAVTAVTVDDLSTAYGDVSYSNLVTYVNRRYFTFDVHKATPGPFSPALKGSRVVDTNGFYVGATVGPTLTYDPSPPVLLASGAVDTPFRTNVSPVPWRVTFSKALTNFSILGLAMTNVSGFSNLFAVGDADFRFDLEPAGPGAVTVAVSAGAFVDAAGNSTPANAGGSVMYDASAPVAVVTKPAFESSGLSPMPGWSVSFSKPVANFSASRLGGSNVAGFASVTGNTSRTVYSFSVIPHSKGSVSVYLEPLAVSDDYGNLVQGAESSPVYFDDGKPVVISSTASDSNVPLIPWTLTFSAAITNFSTSLLTGFNASSFVNLQTSDSTTFSFDLVPSNAGLAGFSIASAVLYDAASNYMEAYVSPRALWDPVKPIVVSDSPATLLTNAGPILWTLGFQKPISNFMLQSLRGYNVASFDRLTSSAPTAFSFDVYPASPGSVSLYVESGAFSDSLGNLLEPWSSISVEYDPVKPVATFIPPASSKTRDSPIDGWFVEFSKPLVAFDVSFLTSANATSFVNLVRHSSSRYEFGVVPASVGNLTVSLVALRARDRAGNYADAVDSTSVEYDPTPVAVSSSTSATYTNGPVPWSITFSKAVTNFSTALLEGRNVSSFSEAETADHLTYSFTVHATSAGSVSFAVPGSTFTDSIGNFAVPHASDIVWYDAAPPVVLTNAGTVSVTSTSPVPWRIVFDKPISSFDLGLLTLVNAVTAGNLVTSTDLRTYNFDVYPSASGPTNVLIPSLSYADLYGNFSASSSGTPTLYDLSPLVATLTSPVALSNASPIPGFVVAFNKPVADFSIAYLSSSSNVASFSSLVSDSSSTRFTFSVTPAAPGPLAVVLNNASVSDLAGNRAASQISSEVIFDNIPPTFSDVPNGGSLYSNSSSIPWVLAFSKEITNFSSSGLVLHNIASVSASTSDSVVYNLSIQPSSSGSVHFEVPESSFTDLYGNYVPHGISNIVQYNGSPPSITFAGSTGPSSTNQAPVPWLLTFSASIANFSLSSLTSTNVAAFGPLGSSSTSWSFYFSVYPEANGAVSLAIPPHAFRDQFGNYVDASDCGTVEYQTSAPIATIEAPDVTHTNSSTLSPFTIAFSSPVPSFSLSHMSTAYNVASYGGLSANPSMTTFTFNVTPGSQGPFRAALLGSVVADPSGNYCAAAISRSIVYDSVIPAVVSASANGGASVTNASPISWSVTFSEPIANFSTSALVPANISSFGSVSTLDQTTFAFTTTPASEGSVSFSIPGGVLTDVAGNLLFQYSSPSISYSNLGPVCLGAVPAVALTNQGPIPWTLTFSKAVANFSSSLVGGTNVLGKGAARASASNTVFTFDVFPASQGSVTISVPALKLRDAAGNYVPAFVGSSAIYDSVPPTATLTAPGSYSNLSVIPGFEASFSKPVNFDLSHLMLTGNCASFGNLVTLSSTSYRFSVTPATNGAVTVTLRGSSASDAAGNYAASAQSPPLMYDLVGPVVSACSANSSAAYANGTITWSLTFSEALASFSTSALTKHNIASFGPASLSNLTYTFTTVPVSVGAVYFGVSYGAFTDLASNPISPYTATPIYYDNVPPVVLSVSANASHSNASPIPWTVTFSKPVANFATSLLNSSNVDRYSSVSASAASYSFMVYPSEEGPVQISVGALRFRDAAGNYAPAYASAPAVIYDATPPVATFSAPYSPTAQFPLPYTLSFDEPVTSMSLSNLSGLNVTSFGGLVSSSDSKSFSFNAYPAGPGDVQISLLSASVRDEAFNYAAPVSSSVVVYSTTSTVVVASQANSGAMYTNGTITWSVTFNNPVPSLDTSHLTGHNITSFGAASSSDSLTYLFTATAASIGPVYFDIPGGTFLDAVGLYVEPHTSPSIYYDNSVPVLLTSVPAATVTNSSPVPWVLTFSKAMSNFSTSSLTGTNIASFGPYTATASGTVYTFDVYPESAGQVTLSVGGSVLRDYAGNYMAAYASSTPFTYDNVPLTASFSAPTGPFNTSPIPGWVVTFSKPVTSFSLSSLSSASASFGNLVSDSSQTSFGFWVYPNSVGDVNVTLGSGLVRDVAGNYAPETTSSSVLFDNVPPAVLSGSVSETHWKTTPITFYLQFSKPLASLASSSVSVLNGSMHSIELGSSNQYTLKITPSTEGEVYFLIPEGAVTDLASNPLPQYMSPTAVYDITRPAVSSISAVSLTSSVTNQRTSRHRIVFDSPIDNFSLALLSTNHNVLSYGNLAVSGNTYSFDLTANVEGEFRVSVPEGAFQDRAGNTVAQTLGPAFTYDPVSPTLISSTPSATVTNVSPIPWTLTFSERLSALSLASLAGNNVASFGNLVDANPVYTFDVYPASQGSLAVSFASNTLFDLASNPVPGYSGAASATYDVTPPEATFTLNTVGINSITNLRTTSWILSFSEPVNTLDLSMLSTAYNASYTNLVAVDSSTYHVDVTAVVPGECGLAVGASKVSDLAGNYCAAAHGPLLTYDPVTPVTLSSATTLPPSEYDETNATPVPWAISFSKALTNFSTTRLARSNVASYTSFVSTTSGSSHIYTFGVYPASQGSFNVSVSSGVFTDSAGNTATAFTGSHYTYDSVPPSASLSLLTTVGDPTNLSTTRWSLTFSEPVASFGLASLGRSYNVDSYANLNMISASNYEFDAIAASSGQVRVHLPSSTVADLAGNYAAGVVGPPINYDGVAPVISSIVPALQYFNSSSVGWTVSFSKKITNFSTSALATSNVSAFTSLTSNASMTIFSFYTSPASQGDITVGVSSGVFTDVAGNYAGPYAGVSATYDSTPFTANIAPNGWTSAYTASSSNPFTITFGKPPRSFDVSQLTGTNATITGFASVSALVYNFDAVVSSDSVFSVALAAGTVQDLAGNWNELATSGAYTRDSTAPSVTKNSQVASSAYTNVSPIPWVISFSEPITNFSTAQLGLLNVASFGPYTASQSNSSFTFNVYPSTVGTVRLEVSASVFTDVAGNYSNPSYSTSVEYNNTPVTLVSFTGPGTYYENDHGVSTEFVVTYNRPINLNSSHIVVSPSATLGSLAYSNDKATWTFNVTASAQNTVITAYVASGALDLYGNVCGTATGTITTTWLRPLTVSAQITKCYDGGLAWTATVSNFVTKYDLWMLVLRSDPALSSNPYGDVVAGHGRAAVDQTASTYASGDQNTSYLAVNTYGLAGAGQSVTGNQPYYCVTVVRDAYNRVAGNTLAQRTSGGFVYTGSVSTWTVPKTGWVKMSVWGGGGGSSNFVPAGTYPNSQSGGYAYGEMWMTAGTVLAIYVANCGLKGTVNYNGGGGGGASGIKWGGTNGTIILEAGGGGGAGCRSSSPQPGGMGGGYTGTRPLTNNGPFGATYDGTTYTAGAGESGASSGGYQYGGDAQSPGGTNAWGLATGGRGGTTAGGRGGGGGGGGYYGGGGANTTNGFGGGGGAAYIHQNIVNGATSTFQVNQHYNGTSWSYGKINTPGFVCLELPF